MPLLRLASLIVATLLVAALSAFVPPSQGQVKTLSNQVSAAQSVAPSTVAVRVPEAAWTRLRASRLDSPHGSELEQLSGQSVPGAGQ